MSGKWRPYWWMLFGLLMLGPVMMSKELFQTGNGRFGFICLCAVLAALLVERISRW